jgi:hypothetical protein
VLEASLTNALRAGDGTSGADLAVERAALHDTTVWWRELTRCTGARRVACRWTVTSPEAEVGVRLRRRHAALRNGGTPAGPGVEFRIHQPRNTPSAPTMRVCQKWPFAGLVRFVPQHFSGRPYGVGAMKANDGVASGVARHTERARLPAPGRYPGGWPGPRAGSSQIRARSPGPSRSPAPRRQLERLAARPVAPPRLVPSQGGHQRHAPESVRIAPACQREAALGTSAR